MTAMKFSEANHAELRALLAVYPEVREGRMFGHPAWFVGRRMFACVYGEGVGLKLPEAEATALLKRAGVVRFQPYGKAPMREWVQVTRARAADYRRDRATLEAAIRYAGAAPAKSRKTKAKP